MLAGPPLRVFFTCEVVAPTADLSPAIGVLSSGQLARSRARGIHGPHGPLSKMGREKNREAAAGPDGYGGGDGSEEDEVSRRRKARARAREKRNVRPHASMGGAIRLCLPSGLVSQILLSCSKREAERPQETSVNDDRCVPALVPTECTNAGLRRASALCGRSAARRAARAKSAASESEGTQPPSSPRLLWSRRCK